MKIAKYILLFFFALSLSMAHANNDDQNEPVNQKSADGKKTGHWIYYGKDKRNKPEYKPEEKVEEGGYVNNRKQGLWKTYYPGEKLKMEAEFKSNRPNGKYTKYHKDGKTKMEEGTWKGTKYVGDFVKYHDNGEVAQKKTFNTAGKTEGKVEYRYPNGKPELVYESKNGVANGKGTRYYPNGDVKENLEYADGNVTKKEDKARVNPEFKLKEEGGKDAPDSDKGHLNPAEGKKEIEDGYHKVYNDQEDLWQDGEFKNGKLWNGKLYKYDKHNLLYKIEIYKNGKYFGDGVLEF